MATGVKSKYHIAIDGKGFMLRGAPMSPRYLKGKAATQVNQLSTGDLNYNSLNGSGWRYWTQTDWSGGFQTVNFTDDASFLDARAVDTTKKYGQITLQNSWVSGFKVTGGYAPNVYTESSFGSEGGVAGGGDGNLIIGLNPYASNKGPKLYQASTVNLSPTLLSAFSSAMRSVNSVVRFRGDVVVGMSRASTNVSAKTLIKKKIGTATISGFRKEGMVVRSLYAGGKTLYFSERKKTISADILWYTSDLSSFTSSYVAGRFQAISDINELGGDIYFLESSRNYPNNVGDVSLCTYDFATSTLIRIYTWPSVRQISMTKYLSTLIITGFDYDSYSNSNSKCFAYSFDGNEIKDIFSDQLRKTSTYTSYTNGYDSATTLYDFLPSFVYNNKLHTKGAYYDGEFWFPGIYGRLTSTMNYTPTIYRSGTLFGYCVSANTGGSCGPSGIAFIGYRDASKYEISGYLISSEFGSNIAGVDKLINSVTLNTETLATGQTVEVYISTDAGSSFTSIGKMSYSADGAIKTKKIFFPSGYVTKLWNYKVQLVGPGTSTPTVKDITFEYRPVPDTRKNWTASIDAGDNIKLLNNQTEQRDGKSLMQSLWTKLDLKQTLVYEDVDGFEVSLVSAMSSTATSARVSDTRLMPPQGRMRIRKNGYTEEMTYTSADGGIIKGISRAQKSTNAQSYTSANKIDNFYNVVITDIKEQVNDTDQKTTESIAQVSILEV